MLFLAEETDDCWNAARDVVASSEGLGCLPRLLIANTRLTYGDRKELLPVGETFVTRIAQLLGEVARSWFNEVWNAPAVGDAAARRWALWAAEYNLVHRRCET